MIPSLILVLLAGTLTAVHSKSCQDMCSSTPRRDSALCKCDADCQVFGDCCGDITPPSSCPPSELPPLQAGVMLDCISTYLNPDIPVLTDNEAFLMVSTCPDSWVEAEGGTIAEMCTSTNFATALPPVTNTATGMVYRNEYCALCNGVRELVAWQTDLVCNQRVYQLLSTQRISDILLSEPDIFQTECRECSFHIPTITTGMIIDPPIAQYYGNTAPRSCTPRVSSCLPQMLLENKTQSIHGDETYALMEEKCVSGALDLVRGTSSGVVYRNHDCAVCNADNMTECYITLPQNTYVPDICFPSADPTTTTITPTTAPTTATTVAATILTENTTGLPDTLPNPETEVITESEPIDEDIIGGGSLFFTITLSNLGGGSVSISTMADSTSITLDCPEGTAPVGLECRPTQCPEGYSEMGGRCSYVFPSSPTPHLDSNSTMVNCPTGILVLNDTDYIDLGNGTIILVEDGSVVVVMDYDEFGHPLICIRNESFLDCLTALVPLNESDYTDLGSNSIIYENENVEVTFYDEHGRPLICPDNTTNTTTQLLLAQLPGLQELTYVGCSLSILGIILILLTYTLFRELQTLPGLILMNLCTTILATNLIFVIGGTIIQSYPVKELCSSLAIVLHFSYLAQFAWMSIFSYEMVRNFHRARKLVMVKKTKHQFFVVCLGIGWGLPLLVTATSITLNFSVNGLVLYGVDKDGRIAGCWINHFESFIIAFFLPLVLCLSCNLLMFLFTTILLCRASRDQSKLQASNNFTLIRVWLANFSITGLTWIFGFVAIPRQVSWLWYPFVIFNSTQGLSMFIAFLFTKKVVRLYLDLFTGKQLKKQPQTSTRIKTTVIRDSKKGHSKECTTISVPSLSSAEILEEKGLVSSNNSGLMMKKCPVDSPC